MTGDAWAGFLIIGFIVGGGVVLICAMHEKFTTQGFHDTEVEWLKAAHAAMSSASDSRMKKINQLTADIDSHARLEESLRAELAEAKQSVDIFLETSQVFQNERNLLSKECEKQHGEICTLKSDVANWEFKFNQEQRTNIGVSGQLSEQRSLVAELNGKLESIAMIIRSDPAKGTITSGMVGFPKAVMATKRATHFVDSVTGEKTDFDSTS